MKQMNESTPPSEIPPIGIWKDLPDTIRCRLSLAGRFATLDQGTYLSVQGKPHDSLAILISGKLRVTCHAHGDTVVLAELGPGDTVGEMSMIESRPASASVQVVDGIAEVWATDGSAFERFVEVDYATGYAVMRLIARELCRRLRKDAENMLNREDALRSRFLDMDY